MAERAHSGESRDVFAFEASGGALRVRLRGIVDLAGRAKELTAARERLRRAAAGAIVDLADVEAIDSGALALLLAWERDAKSANRAFAIEGASDATGRLIRALRESSGQAPPKIGKPPFLVRVGEGVETLARETLGMLDYLGAVTASFVAFLRRPGSLNWRDLPRLAEQIGADALGIVVTINFLVGITLAFMGAIQAKQFGANIFVADGVAIAVARSLGPLMTAVIVAGRSGAGIAAELGTMKVSEEIDALNVLGLDPMRHLVLPRVFVLTLIFPFLVVLGELAAMAGGMLIGVTDLGVTVDTWLTRTNDALDFDHVAAGLIKAVFFGLAIVLIACRRGLQTDQGAEGVGKSTTQAVVRSIFFLVVLESFFTVLFDRFGF